MMGDKACSQHNMAGAQQLCDAAPEELASFLAIVISKRQDAYLTSMAEMVANTRLAMLYMRTERMQETRQYELAMLRIHTASMQEARQYGRAFDNTVPTRSTEQEQDFANEGCPHG